MRADRPRVRGCTQAQGSRADRRRGLLIQAPRRRRVVRRALGRRPAVESAVVALQRIDAFKPVVIVEAVGVPGMIDQAMTDAPRGSRITVVGVCMESDTIRPMVAINEELEAQFCLGCAPDEFAGTLQAIADGAIDVSALITGSVNVHGVPGAFETLSKPTYHVKILVEP